ncbi:MAG: TlpA family protein disulfide reductase [Azoarcus sp.]|jgi:peroxiredoxin|nr:TlpA family protein disulfide reductase [Azoarcus sp.]
MAQLFGCAIFAFGSHRSCGFEGHINATMGELALLSLDSVVWSRVCGGYPVQGLPQMVVRIQASVLAMKIRIFAVLAVVALAVTGFFIHGAKPLAPEVGFTTLKGERINTAALRGKVVLVNFWATSCATCIAEMPRLVETHDKFVARGLETVAVAMSYDPEAQVRAYVDRSALPFKVALDSGEAVARGFGGVRLTPTTFLIDRQGRIVHKYLGEPDFPVLHALLEKLLAEAA